MEELFSTVDAVSTEKQEIKATATELDMAYTKIPYKESEVSANADMLWDALLLFQGYTFYTVIGFQFSYEIRKGRSGDYTKELWIDRRGIFAVCFTFTRYYIDLV